MAFCQNCGVQLNDQTNFCPNCGAGKNNNAQFTQPYTYQPVVQYVKPRIPGRGFGVSSMVLGIIGIVYAVILFIETINIVDSYSALLANSMLPSVAIFSVLSILSIVFSVSAKNKGYRTGVSTSGMVLGVISAILYFISIIMLASA